MSMCTSYEVDFKERFEFKITCVYKIGFRPYRVVRNNVKIAQNLKILLVFEFEFAYKSVDFIEFDVDLAKRTSQNCNVPLPYDLISGL